VEKAKITVVARDESVVSVVTDPAADPFKSVTVAVAEALARPASRGVELAIKWKVSGTPPTPIACVVWVQAGEQKVNFGRFVYAPTGRNGTLSGYSERTNVPSLPASVKRIDVTLVPDTKVAEGHVEIEKIWGKPLELKDVPLQRFDIDSSAATTQAGG
jgi:hypothetical protein